MQRSRTGREDARPVRRGRIAVGLVIVTLSLLTIAGSAQVAAPSFGWGPTGRTADAEPTEVSAAATAQEFLRLVADSRRNDDTAPLPCVLVIDEGGLLNPCMNALTLRWAELEPIERIGSRLTVRTVTTFTQDEAVVTDADIRPRPDTTISVTLEYISSGAGWKVRQLNRRDLPR